MSPSGITPSKSRPKKSPGTYRHEAGLPTGVMESSPGGQGQRNIEKILSDILVKLERIEEKIDENVYPPESSIKPEFIKQVKKAQADIKKGKGKTYNSIDDFFREIET